MSKEFNNRNLSFPINNKFINRECSPCMKLISFLLILAMLDLNVGCMNYFKVTQPTKPVTQSIPELQIQNKIFVLHLENEAWVITAPSIIDNEIICYSSKVYEPVLKKPVKVDKPNRYKKKSYEAIVLNEVHIYVSEMARTNNVRLTIPVSAVRRIEIYEKDKGATTGSYILGGLGISALTFGVVSLIVALTKSSCPFIYNTDGEQPELVGEIYSGSVQPALERDDFLKIPIPEDKKELNLKITNEVKEIQHTNLMELWIFNSDNNTDILVDKYQNYHSITGLTEPINAISFNGSDVTQLIQNKDNSFYSSNEISGQLSLTDGVIMEFPNPEKSDVAKLVIRAKNSFVLDYMMGQFHDQFGNLHSKWVKKQKRAEKEDLIQWSLNQNIPLSLSVERNGVWEYVDYYNIAGPMAFKDDILSFPLDGTESNPLKVKLEAGNFLWEIDYAGIDYSKDSEIKYEIIPVINAITQNGKDVSKMLQKDDNKYYIQPDIGDEAEVSFQLPEMTGEKRIVYMHSKGWYQILRNPSGTPDREYLETFRQPGRFNRFVNDNIQSLTMQQPK